MRPDKMASLNRRIIACKKCPRLADYVRAVSRKKVRRFYGEEYWGRPLPGFGDINCRMLVVGLAPAAHGGTRTGRMFTGDSSADWLARVLYSNGFATTPTSLLHNSLATTVSDTCQPSLSHNPA